MKDGKVPHDRGSQLWQLFAGYLVEVVYDLTVSGRKYLHMLGEHTLPFSVVAAKSFAAASTELDSSIANVVVHASCYDPFRQPCLPISLPMPNVPTFETFPRTRVPALSVCGSMLTASYCAQPTQAHRPAERRLWPWRAVVRGIVGERKCKERGGETAAGYYLRCFMSR